MRRSLALVVAGTLLGLVACGGDSRTPLETVRASADSTTSEDTFAYEMTISGTAEPFAEGVEYAGVFDTSERVASLTMDASQFGIPTLEEVEAFMTFDDGLVIYMALDALLAAAPDEEVPAELESIGWMKMDVADLVEQSGMGLDFGALLSGSTSDPTSGLHYLRGATEVTDVGSEEIRGTETTHYEATIDLTKAAAAMPAGQREAFEQLADLYSDKTLEVEVWIDGDDRVRRYETTQDLSNIELPDSFEGEAPTGTMTIEMEMFDFGTDVDIELPAESDTIDFLELLGGQLEEAGQAIGD